jgi:tetratricopeptide (TPR) repeat protein
MRMWWLLGVWLISQPALACINTPSTDNVGRRFFPGESTGETLVELMTTPRAEQHWQDSAEKVIADARKAPDFAHLTDLGIVLMYQHKYIAAIQLFLAIETLHPGRHETAANLGTALELMGRDALALRWIRLGIRRNQREHEGTEWLHARILEAKIALKNDPDHLVGRSVAGVSFDPVTLPPLPATYPAGNDGKPVKPYELNRALRYQLGERLQFVKPKDPVVANLLMDWATLNAVGGAVENAQALYELAERYGAARTTLIAARQQRLRRILAGSKHKQDDRLGRCPICDPLVEPSYVPPPVRRQGDPPPPPPPPKPYEQ